MLADRDRQQHAIGEVEAPEQAQLLDELPIDRGELGVARHLDQAVMEAEVEQVIALRVLGLDGLLHLLDQGARSPSGRRASSIQRGGARPARPSTRASRRSRSLPRPAASRTNTPRFFSVRTSPASSSMRNASRSGPRETPRRAASAISVSFSPGRSSPERIMRSSSPWTTLESELVCSSVMVGCGAAAAARAGIAAVEANRRRLSTIFKKQLTSFLARTRLRCRSRRAVTELA